MASTDHSVTFYGLSTCIHCKHCREFLEQNNVPFELHYVDLAEGQEREELLEAVRGVNPQISFPTVVIDGKKIIVGFQPEALSKALEL
ncbi:MAG: glutaredoxin family protein [Desulfovibrionaceae bacterium]|nr:glutaredoxin family protein [Desulfovibrionaceae bacterium]